MMTSLEEEKAKLRDHAKAQRKITAAAAGGAAGARFANVLFDALGDLLRGKVLSGYLEIGDELTVTDAMQRHCDNGDRCALPVVAGRDAPLRFREWVPGGALEDGPFRTRHPAARYPRVTPQVLLVPLLAFDAAGYRIGWGGGFYDRILSALRRSGPVAAVGAAYSAQKVERVPRDRHDQPLDWVVTEQETIRCGVTKAK